MCTHAHSMRARVMLRVSQAGTTTSRDHIVTSLTSAIIEVNEKVNDYSQRRGHGSDSCPQVNAMLSIEDPKKPLVLWVPIVE